MQTERVTFLTTSDHKAALDAFAASNGKSVGHVLREASTQYLAEVEAEDEEVLALLVRQVNEALPQMRSDMQEAIAAIKRSNLAIDLILAAGDARQ